MAERKVDVAIIGGGTAGMVAYRQASKRADQVVLIEGDEFGTLCARSGCMPSKLLIAAAEAAHAARHSDQFGIRIDSVGIDSRAVMARVKTERDRFVSGVLDSIERIPDGDIIRAKARFTAPQELCLDDGQRILADRIVIAVGSSTHVVPMLEAAGSRLIT
ncbi:MAG: FAD-dependent oxidoreductase, partial [Wenzhouxiangella sp.]